MTSAPHPIPAATFSRRPGYAGVTSLPRPRWWSPRGLSSLRMLGTTSILPIRAPSPARPAVHPGREIGEHASDWHRKRLEALNPVVSHRHSSSAPFANQHGRRGFQPCRKIHPEIVEREL